jgi:prophage tail gpP-like protein
VTTNHVGVVVAKQADGTYLVAHSSSSKNGVVVTEAWSSGFRYMRRPALYKDA